MLELEEWGQTIHYDNASISGFVPYVLCNGGCVVLMGIKL